MMNKRGKGIGPVVRILLVIIAIGVMVTLIPKAKVYMDKFKDVTGLEDESKECTLVQGARCYDGVLENNIYECPKDTSEVGTLKRYDYDCGEKKVCCFSECAAKSGKCMASCEIGFEDLALVEKSCEGTSKCCKKVIG